jgi:hypothetical protein
MELCPLHYSVCCRTEPISISALLTSTTFLLSETKVTKLKNLEYEKSVECERYPVPVFNSDTNENIIIQYFFITQTFGAAVVVMGPHVPKLAIMTKSPNVKYMNEDWKSWTIMLPSWDGPQFFIAIRHSCRYRLRSVRYSVIHGLARYKAPSYANDDLRLSLLFIYVRHSRISPLQSAQLC